MKKSLLLLALASMSMAAGAQNALKAPFSVPAGASTHQSVTSRGSGYEINFAGSLYSWYTTGLNNINVTAYTYITPEIATCLVGNQVTEITFSCALEVSNTLSGSVFVSEDINGSPVTSTNTTIINAYRNSATGNQTVALATPYTIKENTGFYIGYEVKRCKTSTNNADYPLGVGTNAPNSFAGYVIQKDAFGREKERIDMGTDYGYNLYICAKTVGEKDNIEHVYTIGNCLMEYFTLPVIDVSDGLQVPFELTSWGGDAITSVGYSAYLSSDPETEITGVAETDIDGNSTGLAMINIGEAPVGPGIAEIWITSINGVEVSAETAFYYLGIDNPGYERKFVVEEGTGTWCGWCPRGIVCLDKMSELYPEKFIGIAVHSGDTFADVSTTYTPFINKFFDGFPSCIVNRDPIYNTNPSFDNIQQVYEIWQSQVAPVDVLAEVAKPENGTVDVNVRTTYAFSQADAAGKYKIAIALVEDGLTGNQTNYYAGGANGACGGWEAKGSTVKWTYTDTARGIYNVWGINDSCPESIVANEDVWQTFNVPVNVLTDIEQSRFIVMVLDAESGTILNATSVKGCEAGTTSVAGIEVVNDAPAVYYNMQGIRVENPAAGQVYIVKQGDSVRKTIIR